MFGRWRLLPDARQLLADGEPVALGGRAFDVLLALVEARGELVSKDALLHRAWPSTIVEENNLQVQISALRRTLGEDAARFIATIAGRGYRFTGVVSEAGSAAAGPVAPPVAAAPLGAIRPETTRPLPSSGPPVVVVLPFANMTGDPEQEYFADGITEDLTTALSHARWFSVIARNSAFAYKARTVDVRQVGHELGVGYVLMGSVRKAGSRVRINAQLCETETGRHVWADRFDGDLADIFDMQDHVTEAVAGAIEPSLQWAEAERGRSRPTESLGAYDLYLRALPHRWFGTREASGDALRLLRRALALDPGFAAALGALAGLAVIRVSQRWAEEGEAEEGLRCARALVERGGTDNPSALAWGGYGISYLGHDYDAGLAATERALRMAPNSASVLFLSGWSRLYAGDWRAAAAQVERAMRLSPVDPLTFYFLAALSGAHFTGERYAEAADCARRALHGSPAYLTAHRLLAASLARLGHLDAAREAVAALLAAAPGETLGGVAANSATRGAVRERYLDGLRRAGLPG